MCWRCSSRRRRWARPVSSAWSSTPSPRQAVLEAMTAPARDRRRAGRCLSGAPRAGLSRRLHPVAGAVAQAAGRALGRPRAVGGAAAGLRARARDRGLRRRRNTGSSIADAGDAARRRLRGAAGRRSTARSSTSFDIGNERRGRARRGRRSKPAASRVASVESQAGAGATPTPPFTTSTLQQEASAQARLRAERTPCGSRSASTRASTSAARPSASSPICEPTASNGAGSRSPQARDDDRQATSATHYVPDAPRAYTRPRPRTRRKRTKPSARPTSSRTPEPCARRLDADQARLYELIWKRTVASQMESAELERTTVDIVAAADRQARAARHRPGGHVRRLPHALSGRPRRRRRRRGRPPPAARWRRATPPSVEEIAPTQHFTEPPPRYSEASLVKRMEELGIGRPSTYASILQVLQDRDYVRIDKKRFMPEDKGRSSPRSSKASSSRYVEYDFTADLEEQLDESPTASSTGSRCCATSGRDFIARRRRNQGSAHRRRCSTRSTRFSARTSSRRARTAAIRASARPAAPASCRLKLGKFGAFVGCSNYPECRYTRQLGQKPGEGGNGEPQPLGLVPRDRPRGHAAQRPLRPYVQLGEGEKPKRASLPKGTDASNVRSGTRAQAAVAAARGRQASRNRRADHREFRPLRALRRA